MNKDKLKLKLIKLFKGALIAAAGAGLTYMAEGAQGIDFGEFTPVVVAGFAVAVNAIRQVWKNTDDFEAGYVCGYCDRGIVDDGVDRFHDEETSS
jgi:hypothetical protein